MCREPGNGYLTTGLAVYALLGRNVEGRPREAVKAALYRWRTIGLITDHGCGARLCARWEYREIMRALAAHEERYGSPPWEHGRGPKKNVS